MFVFFEKTKCIINLDHSIATMVAYNFDGNYSLKVFFHHTDSGLSIFDGLEDECRKVLDKIIKALTTGEKCISVSAETEE